MRYASWAMVGVVALGVSTQPFACFPRMKSTPSLKPYERQMPAQPRGTVPFAQGVESPQGTDILATAARPVPATPENMQTGGVYYEYYCAMCHGPGGGGDGTVGHSYVPPAPALNTSKVQALSDAELVKAMLTGVGHEPVLAHTVAPERRGYMIVYLRSLKSAASRVPPR